MLQIWQKIIFLMMEIIVGFVKENKVLYYIDIVYGDFTSLYEYIFKKNMNLLQQEKEENLILLLLMNVDNMYIDNLKSKAQLLKKSQDNNHYILFIALIFYIC